MPHHNIGEHSPFLKRVLVPFWVIRIIIMGINIASMGIAIAALAYVNSNRDRYSNELEELKSNYNVQQALSVAIVILVVQMVLVLICLAGDIACIIKRSRRTLTPKFFLGVNIFQSLFWVVSFILSMLGARTVVSIVINIVVLFSFVGLLIYASIIFHKERTGKLPSPLESHQMLGKNNVETGYYQQTSPQPQYTGTSYSPQPQYAGTTAPHANQ
ncbi:hypothetical protein MCOR27_001941 [Pyricularia oryzae]|uniref:Uncharacterized protein n=2 Tax=Pyricularia TaxID=48558 RepID=A0ABQ8NQN1_PYRGI|nr:hypothetical protein MCOR01_004043 [Pyricularia oryzae]KAI6300658.1 hypothetical protein MCOR33_003687 [Pyricularia grisea]KAH9430681.1 hypothetical protein MCOR02_008018 [Pyricularia oryzae]KAI6286181.1 hypothetical protein MCOR27_001941 [Pyricularia oryzae]KAI6315865.1 hypothetical protein MCOR29_006829 [Pyricularia oryzae]